MVAVEAQRTERLLVAGPPVPDRMGEALDGFKVLGDDEGAAAGQGVHVLRHAVEVGDEDFHLGLGVVLGYPLDDGGEVPGSGVFEVVAVDGRHDDVPERHRFDHTGGVLNLPGVELSSGVARLDVAEAAGPGTDVA